MFENSGIPVSPCTSQCKIDKETHVCKSCFRTLDEIISWRNLNNSDKKLIYETIEKRKEVLNLYKDKKPLPDLSWMS